MLEDKNSVPAPSPERRKVYRSQQIVRPGAVIPDLDGQRNVPAYHELLGLDDIEHQPLGLEVGAETAPFYNLLWYRAKSKSRVYREEAIVDKHDSAT